MNKFDPQTGGHLPKLDDFIWMQEAYLEGFGALLSSLIPDDTAACILTGCNLTIVGNDFELEEGFVFYDNEIFKVNESSGSFNDDEIPCFELVITYGPDDPVEYLDKELKNVHEVREMELVFLPSENDFPYDEETRLEVLIKELLELTGVNDRLDIAEEEIEELNEFTEDLESRVEQTEVDITNLELLETEHEERLEDLEASTVPIGCIVMTDEVVDFDFTSGLGFADWLGWALCDGRNGTPNLKGRFIVGLDTDNSDYEEVDLTGGSADVQLQEEDIPSHNHKYDRVGDHGAGRNLSGAGDDAYEKVPQTRVNTSSYGGEFFPEVDTREYDTEGSPDPGDPDFNPNYGNVIAGELIPAYYETRAHENRPPYYVLAYVKKIS